MLASDVRTELREQSSGESSRFLANTPFEILLIEDNRDHVELALHAMRRLKFPNKVRVARDGAEALQLLFGDNAPDDHQPLPRLDVILLDLKLPKVDGLDVLAKAKADERTRSIPVVVLTSSLQESDRDDSQRLGATEYISKPVTSDKLNAAFVKIGLL